MKPARLANRNIYSYQQGQKKEPDRRTPAMELRRHGMIRTAPTLPPKTECLNANWALTLSDAGEKMKAWPRYYNEDRPHGANGYKAPFKLENPGSETGQPPRQSPKTPATGDPTTGFASEAAPPIGSA